MTNVGIVGFGLAGQGFHAPLIRAAGLTVAAISTSDPTRRAEAEQFAPGAVIVPGFEELLQVPGLDLVVLASPSARHAGQALAAIEAGIPVVVDKPLGVTAEEALEVVVAAAAAGVALTVFHNRRYDPEFATLRGLLKDNRLGTAYRLEMRWDRWRPVPKERWREQNSAAEGGGLLLDLHSHLVDQAVQLFGPVETVYADVSSYTTVAEDDAYLICSHVSGMVSHLEASSIEGAPGPRIRLHASKGTYLLAREGDQPAAFTQFDNSGDGGHGYLVAGDDVTAIAAATGPDGDPATFYRQVAAALTAPDPQGAMPVDPRDAVHVLAVLDAARASAAANQVVRVLTPGSAPESSG